MSADVSSSAVSERGVRVRPGIASMVSVLSWVALLAVAAFLVVAVVLPRVVGGQAYTVLSPSMTPTYPPGALVVVRPVDPTGLGIGDVITYQLHSGRPEVVTHRVIAVSTGTDGASTFTTQGDHNDTADPAPVVPGQIRGEVWFGVPLIGYASRWLSGSARLVALTVVIGALVLYAGAMFVGARRDARPGRTTPTARDGSAPGESNP